MKNTTKMSATLVLLFNENENIKAVCEKIGLKATKFAKTDRTPQNESVRIKHELEFNAYWKYSIPMRQTPYLNEVLEILHEKTHLFLHQFKQVLCEYNGSAIIEVVLYAKENDSFGLHIGRNAIKLASELNAEIDIDTYIG